MISDISFKGDGFIRIDPRTKMAVFVLCSFAALKESRTLYQSILFFFMFAMLINGRQYVFAVKMLMVYGVLYSLNILVFLMEVPEGLRIFIMGIIVFRMFLPVLMAFALIIKTTKVSELLVAFDKMHFPGEITIPFSVMFRFFPTIVEEWENIQNAMKFRGFALNLKNILTRPSFIYECTIVPLLSDTVIIADELSAASLCRGLGASTKRTSLVDVRMRMVDYLIIGFAIWLNIVSFGSY
ncbi:MAG: energy-coupling factor transporter transmembrane protein EcfT [Lachnospiraceae bacterium]|nr:energy-coupling factor transporter transmembrane protein EcfT [Lachnospiraceae bacterium]